jgi:hypothetical protein
MKTHHLRLLFEILLGGCLVSSLLLAYAISLSNEALGEQIVSLKKQAQETRLTLSRQLYETRLEKESASQPNRAQIDPELAAIRSAFSNGVVLKDLETYYKSQKNWSTERQVGIAALQLLANGAQDDNTIASIQKALEMAEFGLQKKCALQSNGFVSTKTVC